MPHPSFGGAITPSGSPGSGLPVTITANIPEGEKFYEQSMTLLEFLADTEGERFVGQIGEALVRNERIEDVLKRARKSPKKLKRIGCGVGRMADSITARRQREKHLFVTKFILAVF